MDIKQILKSNREKLSDSSLKTYTSLLRALHKQMYGKEQFHIDNFNKTTDVIKYVNQIENINKRKTLYSALYILTNKKKYNDFMRNDIEQYRVTQKQQTKNVKEKSNWIDFSQIKEMHSKLKKDILKLMNIKNLSMIQLQEIQQFIILSLCSGVYNSPRRSLDYTEMVVKNGNDSNNYIDFKKKEFVFNIYKTQNTYDQQRIDIHPELFSILKKWIKIIPKNTNYLLFNEQGKKLTPVTLNQRLNKLFGKKISTTMLRKIFLSDLYKDIPKLEELQETAENMGHSVNVALTSYVKK